MGSLYPYADPTIMLWHKIVRKNISIPLAAPADGMQPPTFNHGRITCEQTVISILKTLGIDSKVDNKRNAKETQIDGRVRHLIFSQTLKALAKYVRSSLKMLSIDSKVDNKRSLHAKETQIDGRVTYSGCSTTTHTNMVKKVQGLNQSYINIVNNIGEDAQQVAAV